MRTLRGRVVPGAVMLAASVALGACGGGDENDGAGASATTTATSTSTASSTAAPEDHIAPDAQVATGLVSLKAVGAKAAAAADGDAAKAAAEGLEPVWQPIEGTVKKNEPDLYLEVEDSFQRLESGNLANAKKGAQALNTAVDAYLAKHPAS
jgi:hypothetical protein